MLAIMGGASNSPFANILDYLTPNPLYLDTITSKYSPYYINSVGVSLGTAKSSRKK